MVVVTVAITVVGTVVTSVMVVVISTKTVLVERMVEYAVSVSTVKDVLVAVCVVKYVEVVRSVRVV
jgi:hypothetical protein